VRAEIDRSNPDNRAARIGTKVIVSLPILRRPYRTEYKSAAAVWAYVFQEHLRAILAKGALEAANHGFG
jgi:hypothetical protein